MKITFSRELDFILQELAQAYEKQFHGIIFYPEGAHQTLKEEIAKKVEARFDIREWEVNLLFHQLLNDDYIVSMEPAIISMEGLLLLRTGGYTQKYKLQDAELDRMKNLEKSNRFNSFALVLFTALLAFGTLVAAWYFAIEIWLFYHHSGTR